MCKFRHLHDFKSKGRYFPAERADVETTCCGARRHSRLNVDVAYWESFLSLAATGRSLPIWFSQDVSVYIEEIESGHMHTWPTGGKLRAAL